MKISEIKKFILEVIESVLISLLIFVLLSNFVLYSAIVEGTSMYPNLKDGDIGFGIITTKNIGINRFDTVIIKPDGYDKKLVKRVIGMPNDSISYIDNKLYVNGEYVEEDFLADGVITEDLLVILGDNEYYCLGDNRQVSRDSRYYGPFSYEEFIASHMLIISPFSSIGYVK